MRSLIKNKLVIFSLLIFAALGGWWAYLNINELVGETDEAELFSAIYGVMALFGGVVGLFISKYWGGVKSYIGRSVFFIALGLLAQEFGQIAYSLYTYLWHQEIPYPSLGDLGYFSSVIFYIIAVFSIIKATSSKDLRRSPKNKLLAAVLPLILLGGSYWEFLRGYEFDFSNPLVVFLDFGYPLGQAFYISLAIFAFLISRKYLGGVMRPAILTLIAALVVQYVADFTFLYQVSRETWQTGGSNEFIYLFAYFLMTVALIGFKTVYSRITGGMRTEQNSPSVTHLSPQPPNEESK